MLSLLSGSMLGACAGEDTSAPPLFNAIDPSLQCPAGQVGWDFTTGGGQDQDVVPAPVGNEIKVQEVSYLCSDTPTSGPTSLDLTASFRTECDNAVKCVRPLLRTSELSKALLCSRKSVRATYRCGNESTLYTISRLNWTSPSVRAIVRDVPNEPSQELTFACGNVITIRGYNFRSSSGTQSVILEDKNSCNGKRRCYSNEPGDTSSTGTVSLYTKYFYTCGNETAVRQSIMDNTVGAKHYIDFHCADDAAATGIERAAVLFIKDLTYTSRSSYPDVSAAAVKEISDRLKAACEGRRSCAIPVKPADLPQNINGAFKVEYWCGASKSFTERKYFHTTDLLGKSFKGLEEIALQCGGRLRIADGTGAWVANECPDGARVCSLPLAEADTRINFFCENGGEGASTSQWLYTSATRNDKIYDRSIECPLESAATGGIKITGMAYDGNSVAEKAPVSAFSACNGKQSCMVRHYFDNTRYQYRYTCPNASEVKSVKTMVDGSPREYLDCKPNLQVDSVRLLCETGSNDPSSNVKYHSAARPFCTGTSPTCALNYGNLWDPTYLQTTCTAGVNVNYRCGGDAVKSTTIFPKGKGTADGGYRTEDGGSILVEQLSCPYDPTPRSTPSTKKCIPLTCPNNQKRNEAMDCVADSQIVTYPSLISAPYMRTPAGVGAFTVLEGFPYITYLRVQHQAPAMASTNAGTMWAYDVFKRKDNSGAEVRAFRCIVGSMGFTTTANGYSYFGNTLPNEVGLLPNECFKEAPYGDLTSSWYHGSRRANVMNEQVFRNDYKLLRTMLVAAFDSKGRAVLANKTAPNPVGFFYTPASGYVDQYDYLAQTTDFDRGFAITFQPSRQIELKATSGRLGQSQLLLDKETFRKPPTLDLDFGWNMLGDSPFHPFSDKRIVQLSNLGTLRWLNPRVSVEIAKVDSALTNIWAAENSAVLSNFSLSGGNPQEKKDRFELQIPSDVVKRMMSVKGGALPRRADGWMKSNVEVNSAFKLRLCIDIDGISRSVADTNIDNKFTSATVNGTEYKLGITRRCSEEFPFTVTRDLFPKPVLPINAAETPVENGSTTAQGGNRVSSNNDVGSQQSCRRSCTVNGDCGAGGTCDKPPTAIGVCLEQSENVQCKSTFRKNMTTGGKSFGRSMMGVSGTSDTDAAGGSAASPMTSSKNTVNMMSFTILDSEEKKEGVAIAGGTRKETRISLGRVWASVGQIADAIEKLKKTAPASPVKPWFKPSFSRPFAGKSPLPGLAFGISVDGYVFAGPVVLYLEISFQAQISFDIVLKFVSDKQTIATKTAQALYGCLDTVQCLKLSTTEKNFVDANEDCNLQGGRLAEPRSAAKLTALKSAAGTNDIWVGAQASHIFDDPTCVDLSTVAEAQKVARMAECKATSATRYHWINGNVPFSDNQADGAAYNQNLYTLVQGFGSIVKVANNGSPLRSAVLLKTTGALENHAITNKLSASSSVVTGVAVKTAKYVCEFDPAGAYKASEVSIGPALEASVGVGASACWPSGVVGACLSAEFKFITVGISVEYGSKSVKIFDGSNTATEQPRATIGGKGSVAKWEWAALTGRLYAEIRFFFGSKDFNIVSYSGVAAGGSDLWDNTDRFRRDKP